MPADNTDALLVIDRLVPAPPTRVWELWTTPQGISQWWAPDGFRTDVEQLDLVPGGDLVYTMTTVDPDQVAFMEQHGLPLTTRSRKRFIEVAPPTRLAYSSLVDFVPGQDPYEQITVVDLSLADDEGWTHVTMRMEPLHDEEWTARLVAGRTNELENLARLAEAETQGAEIR